MIKNQNDLDAYLTKMRPKISESVEEVNAKPSRISVKRTNEGELLSTEKAGVFGKPLNLLLSNDKVKFWRKNPDKVEFEGDKTKDLVLKYQYVGVALPWGLGAVSINMNTEESHYLGNNEAGWWSFKEDVSEKDVKIFADFVRRNKTVGIEYPKLCKEFIDLFDDRDSALELAAREGRLDDLKLLMNYGFPFDAGGDYSSPLLEAIQYYYRDEKQDEVISLFTLPGSKFKYLSFRK